MSINALLIEDDSDLAEAIADYMELDGFELDFAYNGAAGLNLALEGRYDIILTDINMPKMDGLDVCQSLRHSYSHVNGKRHVTRQARRFRSRFR